MRNEDYTLVGAPEGRACEAALCRGGALCGGHAEDIGRLFHRAVLLGANALTERGLEVLATALVPSDAVGAGNGAYLVGGLLVLALALRLAVLLINYVGRHGVREYPHPVALLEVVPEGALTRRREEGWADGA